MPTGAEIAAPPAPGHDPRLSRMRVAAALAIVLLHVSADLDGPFQGTPSLGWWTANLADSFSRWAVPLFVMLSGALLIGQGRELTPGEFYRRRARKILIPLLFWSALYTWRRIVFFPAKLDPDHGLCWNALMPLLMGTPAPHLWFLWMLAGLYLAAPFLRRMARAATPRELDLFVAIGLALAAASKLCEVLLGLSSGPMLLSFPLYIPYFVAGYRLTQWELKPRRASALAAVAALCVAAIVAVYYLALPLGLDPADELAHSPLSPPVILLSLAVFLLGLSQDESRSPWRRWVDKAIERLAPATFGVYLIHPLWIEALGKWGLHARWIHPALGIPAVTLAAFALSALTALLLARIPLLRKTVF